MDFIHSDYAVVNAKLAQHYRIPNVHGLHFRKVALEARHQRGGLTTGAAVLAMNSDGKDSHPLKRGVWMLERIRMIRRHHHRPMCPRWISLIRRLPR